MSSSQLFSSILNPLSRLSLDLSEIEKEEKEIHSKIVETRKELEYADNLVRKYEQIRYSLASKLDLLENQKDNCSMKRRKLVQKMSGGSLEKCSSMSSEESKDCLIGSANNEAGIKVKNEEEDVNQDEEDDENSLPMDLVAGLLKTLNEGSQAYNLSELTNPDIDFPLPKYSNGNETNGLQTVKLREEPLEKPFESSFLTKCFSSVVNSNNNKSETTNQDVVSQGKDGLFGSQSAVEVVDTEEDWLAPVSPTPTSVSSQPPRFFTKNHSHHKVQHNSVLALEATMTGYVYKSLSDGTVMRYRFANANDNRYYRGHGDKVKVLFFDSKLQMLYTGCDDGKVRCFNANTGSLLNEFLCDGNVISVEKCPDGHVIFGTNKGWIYYLNNHFVLQASHRTFNWIFAVKLIVCADKKNLNARRLLVAPMKHKPTIIDALTGKAIQEINSDVIESRPCIQVNGNICILTTVLDKNEPGRSTITVFDATNNWKSVQTLTKEGIISSLCTKGNDLYVGIKFPSYGHIQCFKWSSRILTLKWVACVAYVHTLAVMPSDIVLNGGPDGNVYNTTPNLKGPFLCTHKRCSCKLPFARRKDLEFHYSKLPNS